MSEKRADGFDGSGGSDGGEKRKRLRPSGGYRKLRSFQTATAVYDATVSFCNRYPECKGVRQLD